MKEKDDLTVLRLAAEAIDASAEQNRLTAPSSRNEVVTTALLRKLWARRMLIEIGEQDSCGCRLDSDGPPQSDDEDHL
jgi:hypothetical protein